MAELAYQEKQQGSQAEGVRQRKAVLQDNRRAKQTAKPISRTTEGTQLFSARKEENGARDTDPLVQDIGKVYGSNQVAQRTKVRNLVGTSHLKSKRARSWKAHHTSAAGKKAWQKCLVKGCRNLATVGAHVEDTSVGTHTTNRYIAPFCQYHNKRPAGTILTLKPGGSLVGVGPKKRVRKTD